MPCATPTTFSREKRLQKRREFLLVQRHGERSFGRFVVAIAQKPHQLRGSRLGITVPKKVGPAHARNKIKRRIRHIMRLNQDLFFEKILVIIAKESARNASFSELLRDIEFACRKFKQNRPTTFPRRSNVRVVLQGSSHEYSV